MVISFETEKAARYLEQAFSLYLDDPADSDFQRGYLDAMLTIYRECLGKGLTDSRLALLDAQVSP